MITRIYCAITAGTQLFLRVLACFVKLVTVSSNGQRVSLNFKMHNPFKRKALDKVYVQTFILTLCMQKVSEYNDNVTVLTNSLWGELELARDVKVIT